MLAMLNKPVLHYPDCENDIPLYFTQSGYSDYTAEAIESSASMKSLQVLFTDVSSETWIEQILLDAESHPAFSQNTDWSIQKTTARRSGGGR